MMQFLAFFSGCPWTCDTYLQINASFQRVRKKARGEVIFVSPIFVYRRFMYKTYFRGVVYRHAYRGTLPPQYSPSADAHTEPSKENLGFFSHNYPYYSFGLLSEGIQSLWMLHKRKLHMSHCNLLPIKGILHITVWQNYELLHTGAYLLSAAIK